MGGSKEGARQGGRKGGKEGWREGEGERERGREAGGRNPEARREEGGRQEDGGAMRTAKREAGRDRNREGGGGGKKEGRARELHCVCVGGGGGSRRPLVNVVYLSHGKSLTQECGESRSLNRALSHTYRRECFKINPANQCENINQSKRLETTFSVDRTRRRRKAGREGEAE